MSLSGGQGAHGHRSVMLRECVDALAVASGGRYVDATLGMGGHTEAILEASSPAGQVLGLDRDPEALRRAERRLARFAGRVHFCALPFSQIAEACRRTGWAEVDGVLADLGVSSIQIDEGERGFSFAVDGPLDMRMGGGCSARELLGAMDQRQLAACLRELGEVSQAGRLASRILAARDEGRLDTTFDLVRAVRGQRPAPRHYKDPVPQVFQAIRMAVNDELGELRALLDALPSLVRVGGRIAIISFHSLEDRLVKQTLRPPAPAVPPGWPVEPEAANGPWIDGPPRGMQRPSEEEVAANSRARSARLRVGTRRGQEESR